MKIKNYYLLFVIFIAVLPFRLYGMSNPLFDTPASFRQAQTATVALNYYKTGIDLSRSELDIFGLGKEKYLTLEFPIYQAIIAVLYRLFFVSDIWGRILSVFFGFIGAFYLFKLVFLLEKNTNLALVTVYFFLLAPLNITYQKAYLIESMVIGLLLTAFYLLVSWVQNQKNIYLFYGILLLSLSYLQKAVYGPFWLLPLFVQFVLKRKKTITFKMLLVLTVPLLIVSVWQKHADFLNIINNQAYFASSNPQLFSWNFGLMEDRFSPEMWLTRLDLIFKGIFLKPGLIFFIFGLYSLNKLKEKYFWLSFLLSQIIYFLVLFRIQSHDYYQMVMIPVFSLFMANGVLKMSEFAEKIFRKILKKKIQLLQTTLLVFLLLIYLWRSWIYARWNFVIDWNRYQSLIKIGSVLTGKSPGLLVTEGYNWNSLFTYYTGKKMLLLETEKAGEEEINKLRNEGYSFIMLESYKKYPGYLKKKNVDTDFSYLNKYELVYNDDQFKVYLFN